MPYRVEFIRPCAAPKQPGGKRCKRHDYHAVKQWNYQDVWPYLGWETDQNNAQCQRNVLRTCFNGDGTPLWNRQPRSACAQVTEHKSNRAKQGAGNQYPAFNLPERVTFAPQDVADDYQYNQETDEGAALFRAPRPQFVTVTQQHAQANRYQDSQQGGNNFAMGDRQFTA